MLLQGPITQKKVLESVELAESLRDSLKAWSNSPDEGIGRVQVLKRLKVQVEDVRGQNGSFVIPRVHLSKSSLSSSYHIQKNSSNRSSIISLLESLA